MTKSFDFVYVALASTLLVLVSDAPLVDGKNLCGRLQSGKTKVMLLGRFDNGANVMLITSDMKVYQAPTETIWNANKVELTVPANGVSVQTKWPKMSKETKKWSDAALVSKNSQEFLVVSPTSQKGSLLWQSLKTANNFTTKQYKDMKDPCLLVSSVSRSLALTQKGDEVCFHDLVFLDERRSLKFFKVSPSLKL